VQYDEPMPRLGFDTYVFIERIAANAAALHPFPEHRVGLVREALADAGEVGPALEQLASHALPQRLTRP